MKKNQRGEARELTTSEVADYLRRYGLDIDNWPRLPLPAETTKVIRLDREYHAENLAGHMEQALREVFLPTQFGCVSGFKFMLPANQLRDTVFVVGMRIFVDCDYKCPNEWIWAPGIRDRLCELVNSRAVTAICSDHNIVIEVDPCAAAIVLYVEGKKPDFNVDHVESFLVGLFESGGLEMDIQDSFYCGWKLYAEQIRVATCAERRAE